MKTIDKQTQCGRILRHLTERGPLTQMDALRDYGILRLAARISDLRGQGKEIGRRMVARQNRYGDEVRVAEYYLEQNKEKAADVGASTAEGAK